MSQNYSRRDFAKLGLTALPAASLFSILPSLRAQTAAGQPKPDSKVAGVQIGINVPYSFSEPAMSGDETLAKCIQLNLSAVELRTQPVEAYMGSPNLFPKKQKKGVKPSAADVEAEQDRVAKLKAWRLSAPMAKATEFRKIWDDAGVSIDIVKVDTLFKMDADEIDYSFELVKTLGARAMSSEISFDDDEMKRMATFATKHKMMVGYHGHTKVTPELWEKAFSYSKYCGANVDLGHFIAGNNYSPVPFITKYHDRVTHVHIKDRKLHDGPNTELGKGDTPVAEVLRLIRDKKWKFDAVLEFEYPIPEGSTRMAEIAKMAQYCRTALMS